MLDSVIQEIHTVAEDFMLSALPVSSDSKDNSDEPTICSSKKQIVASLLW